MTILEIAELNINVIRLNELKEKYKLGEDYNFLKVLNSIEKIYNKYDKEQREIINKYKKKNIK
jgi:hypothetical protein